MNYKLSPEAQQDLLEIEAYISQDNYDAAFKVVDAIEAAFVMLVENPMLGHRRRDIKTIKPVRFWTVYKHYQVVYLEGSSPLSIVRIVSGYRNVPSLIENDPQMQ